MKKIRDFEKYGITSCGRVYNFEKKRFVSGTKNSNGYYIVTLYNDQGRKNFYIHKLVAEYYIPNPNNYDTVDHTDGIKEHNYTNNLQWMSNFANNSKGHSKAVKCIETGEVYSSQSAAATALGINRHTVANIIKRKGDYKGLHYTYLKEGC